MSYLERQMHERHDSSVEDDQWKTLTLQLAPAIKEETIKEDQPPPYLKKENASHLEKVMGVVCYSYTLYRVNQP